MRAPFALLSVEGVTVRFGGVTALDDVRFQVGRGQICGLIGPNGAGKTTLFNCISRLYEPSVGDIRFEGRPLSRIRRHEIARLGVARTFQNLALFATMTVRAERARRRACFRARRLPRQRLGAAAGAPRGARRSPNSPTR